MRAGNFIINQSKLLLENKQQAILFAVILAILPFASWLSVALVSLITLRKGFKPGFEVMFPALVIHSIPLMLLVPIDSAIINALITYVPCYIAALSLRQTRNWQNVFGTFFLQALLGFLFIQQIYPEFAVNQLNQLKYLLAQYHEYQQFLDYGSNGISPLVLAQLFSGIQILSVIASSVISLIFARSIQAKLFVPDGFRNELTGFRSGRLAFLVLIAVSLGYYFEIALAITVLPLVLSYFLLSGFNLAYFILARKWRIKVFILLIMLVFIKPIFAILAFIVFGSLDSLFNFRMYLPSRVREST